MINRKLSKYDICEMLYARALVITEATYGLDHPEVLFNFCILFLLLFSSSSFVCLFICLLDCRSAQQHGVGGKEERTV